MMSLRDNLKKGCTEIIVLSLLANEDMYGYQLAQEIKLRSNGSLSILEGSLYPILHRLSAQGYLSEAEEFCRRRLRIRYHLDETGREYLARCLAHYEDINLGIRRILHPDVPESQA